jgi:dihydroflavonol-4-reductase
VLVTGGAGFVGSHLVDRLVAVGRRVRVLELPGVPADHLPTPVEVIRGDIRSAQDVRRALQGCAVVFHVAGNPNLWTQRRGDFHAVNYVGACNVLKAAVQQRVHCAVHTSTESILSGSDPSKPLCDDGAVRLRDVVGAYGRSKSRAERFALELGCRGYPVYVACPTMPVGPGDHGISPPTRLIADFCNGRLPAILDCKLNMVDVRDLADAMVRLRDEGVPGRRYLMGGHNVRLSELLELLGRITGIAPTRRRVPYRVALVVALVSEWLAAVVTDRPPSATVAGVTLAGRNLHVADGHTVARFGITPRALEWSLRDAVVWLRETGVVRPVASWAAHPMEVKQAIAVKRFS